MHPRELANMALTASSVAEDQGFEQTAKAFIEIAEAALAQMQTNEADMGYHGDLSTPRTKFGQSKVVYT